MQLATHGLPHKAIFLPGSGECPELGPAPHFTEEKAATGTKGTCHPDSPNSEVAAGVFGCRCGGFQTQVPPRPGPPHRTHRCRNSWKRMRLGKPWRQMRMPSRTPLQRNWSSTSRGSSLPACGERGRTRGVGGGHTGAPLTGRQPPGETRTGPWADQKSWAISHGSTSNLLSTYCRPDRNPCPGGAHSPEGDADNK